MYIHIPKNIKNSKELVAKKKLKSTVYISITDKIIIRNKEEYKHTEQKENGKRKINKKKDYLKKIQSIVQKILIKKQISFNSESSKFKQTNKKVNHKNLR